MGTRGMFAFAWVLVAGAATAQLPDLEPAVAVDVGVKTVAWNPAGTALLYTKEDSEGIGLGIYAAGQREGKVLLRLPPGDRYETEWFESAPVAVVIVYRRVDLSGSAGQLAEVHLLDAKTLKDKLVFRRTFETEGRVEIDVDPSPGMVHAIFRLRVGEEQQHLVLPLSGNPLLSAPDLDRALAEGFQGPAWSVDGTAVYSKAERPTQDARLLVDPATGNAEIKLSVVMDRKMPVVGDIPLISKFFLVRNPVPPPGAPVLEVMPANGALRPVRFKGAWTEREVAVPRIATQDVRSPMILGVSRGEARSLWLTQGEKAPTAGVLVAAQADQAWLSPRNRAVAYVTDGALFVRAIRG